MHYQVYSVVAAAAAAYLIAQKTLIALMPPPTSSLPSSLLQDLPQLAVIYFGEL